MQPHKPDTQFKYIYSKKLLDYMASGKPIVAYALRPIVKLLTDYPQRVLVRPNSVEALAEGIIEAIRLYHGSRIVSTHILKDHDWEKVGARLAEIYRAVYREGFVGADP